MWDENVLLLFLKRRKSKLRQPDFALTKNLFFLSRMLVICVLMVKFCGALPLKTVWCC